MGHGPSYNNMTMKYHERGTITRHEMLEPGYYLLAMQAPEIAATARPGQFVHLLVDDRREPFLRRPLSILYADEGEVAVLYKVVGEGTALLAERRAGDVGDMIGPLGNGFSDAGEARVLFVAGGIGIVPLVYFAQSMDRAGERVHFVFGAAGERDLVLQGKVQSASARFDLATIDGTRGKKGTVIDILNDRYPADEILPEVVYACGPGPMLEALYEWIQKRDLPGWFSLENHMGCGIGACLGCVLPRRNGQGYVRVCHEGPVFDAYEVECRF